MVTRSFAIRLTAAAVLLASALACGSQAASVAPEATAETGSDVVGGSTDSGATTGSVDTSDNSGGGSASDGMVDACAILIADDVQSILGVSVDTTPDTSQSTGDDLSCIWNATDGVHWAQVLVHSMGSGDAAVQEYDSLKSLAGDDPSSPPPEIPGIGESAIFDSVFHWLIVKQGSYVLVFSAKLDSDDAVQGALTGVAPALVGRLPQ